jgi:hypothetical protein
VQQASCRGLVRVLFAEFYLHREDTGGDHTTLGGISRLGRFRTEMIYTAGGEIIRPPSLLAVAQEGCLVRT